MTDCPKCGHPWPEHQTTAGSEGEHECRADAGHMQAPLQDCGCMEIPPGHAPDWVWCVPCAGPKPEETP